MTPSLLASVAGIILSLLFSYVPGFETWYTPLSPNLKRIIMLGFIILVAVAAFALSCVNIPIEGNTVTCDTPGALGLLKAFIACLIANQSAFALSPRKVK